MVGTGSLPVCLSVSGACAGPCGWLLGCLMHLHQCSSHRPLGLAFCGGGAHSRGRCPLAAACRCSSSAPRCLGCCCPVSSNCRQQLVKNAATVARQCTGGCCSCHRRWGVQRKGDVSCRSCRTPTCCPGRALPAAAAAAICCCRGCCCRDGGRVETEPWSCRRALLACCCCCCSACGRKKRSHRCDVARHSPHSCSLTCLGGTCCRLGNCSWLRSCCCCKSGQGGRSRGRRHQRERRACSAARPRLLQQNGDHERGAICCLQHARRQRDGEQ